MTVTALTLEVKRPNGDLMSTQRLGHVSWSPDFRSEPGPLLSPYGRCFDCGGAMASDQSCACHPKPRSRECDSASVVGLVALTASTDSGSLTSRAARRCRARIDVASAARHLLAALEVNDPESVEESKRSLSRYLDEGVHFFRGVFETPPENLAWQVQDRLVESYFRVRMARVLKAAVSQHARAVVADLAANAQPEARAGRALEASEDIDMAGLLAQLVGQAVAAALPAALDRALASRH